MEKEKKPLSKKKKILFHSCHSRQFSGFGKNCKNILKYLCSTNKYEIVEFANAFSWSDESLKTLPWKCIGSGPDEKNIIAENNENEITGREMSYGLLKIDEVIKKEKPDIYIGAEDIWAFLKTINKPWWNKTNCMIWTTLDSLPLLPESLALAPKIKNYYTWASFAQKAMNKEGFNHVKTLHGAIDISNFNKITKEKRDSLRKQQGITDDFIIGFVFRNQLRKSIPNLLDGFKLFKTKFPKSKPKLLLHTGWHEGWDIPSLIKEKKIKNEDILTTYFCNKCKSYKISPFMGQEINCSNCKSSKMQTISVQNGPSERQLNEIYNMMDVYCHPFTSGGQEIPIQEAKLTELITLSTNYSCGEDMNQKGSYGLPLEWEEYREAGTQFIKASTKPKSICDQLERVYKMSDEKKLQWGREARNFVIKNYSTEEVGKQLEKILDEMPEIDYDFKFEFSQINPNYIPPRIADNKAWVIDIYKNMFSIHLKKNDVVLQHWVQKLNSGLSREEVFKGFKNTALKEKSIKKPINEVKKDIESSIQNKSERIGVVCTGGKYETLTATSVLKNIKETYPGKKIFFITHPANFQILNGNPFIFKKIKYFDGCEDPGIMESSNGIFDVCYFLPKECETKNMHKCNKDLINISINESNK